MLLQVTEEQLQEQFGSLGLLARDKTGKHKVH